MPKAPEEAALTMDTLKSFGMAKVFKHHQSNVTSLDFDRSGQFLVSSGKDDAIHFYKVGVANPVKENMLKKKVICKRFGANHVRFTHHPRTVLAACKDHNIRYHSLHDNAYLRVYTGHTARIRGIKMSPTTDSFMSWADDRTVRLWDLRSRHCQAYMEVSSTPLAAYDNEGLIFAMCTGNDDEIKLYDVRQYHSGPFDTFNFPKTRRTLNPGGWCGMNFSPDGKEILVSTNQNFMMTIDSFSGSCLQTFSSHVNDMHIDLFGTYTSDGKYVCTGSSAGDIHFWERESGEEVAVWKGHPRPVQHVIWNPVFLTCVTAGTATAVWHPRERKSIIKSPKDFRKPNPKTDR